jgi:hypothetical protein
MNTIDGHDAGARLGAADAEEDRSMTVLEAVVALAALISVLLLTGVR